MSLENIQTDAEGYLANREDWSEELAQELAASMGVSLTDEHWKVLNTARAIDAESGSSPGLRKISKRSETPIKAIYKLFPEGPAKAIAKATGRIEMEWADWFYIEDCVWDSALFWEIVADCARQNRFNHGVWPMIDSLWETVIPRPAHVRPLQESKADRLRHNKRCFLVAQYHIARINRDSNLAQKLSRRYTNWAEIGKLLDRISPRAG